MSVLKGIIPKEDALLLGGYPAKIFEAVDATPPIEPKRGKWEDVEADEGEWICFKCSECGHDAYSYTGEILSNEWKFCPYCGVRTERSE